MACTLQIYFLRLFIGRRKWYTLFEASSLENFPFHHKCGACLHSTQLCLNISHHSAVSSTVEQNSWTEQLNRTVEQNRSVQTLSLTTACWVHSNVYDLVNVHWIRYLTVVDPIHSTSSTVQTYHHAISGSVKIPLATRVRNSSSVGKEPVPSSMRSVATSSQFSCAEQGILIMFTNVFKSHDTVVVVYCTSEREPDITCIQEGSDRNTIMIMY